MYGIPLKNWQRTTILAVYILAVIGVYANVGFGKIFQIFGIPVIEYGLVAVLALLFGGGLWVYGKLKSQPAGLESKA
jgi:hypothetical protein